MSNKNTNKIGLILLIRLARFKKHCRTLEQPIYPQWIKEAAKIQGIIIKD